MSNLTPERRLKKVTINLMRNPIFADWSGILMLGKKTIVDNFPTAATDGWDEIYGRAFVARCNDKELAFAVIHEGGHKLYRHMTVWQALWKIDPECANKAADHMLNLKIMERDPEGTIVELPKIDGKVFVCYDKRFTGMDTKQIFDILRAEKKKGRGEGDQPGNGDEPGGSGNGPGETFDGHDWEGAKKRSKAEQDQIVKEIDQAIRQGQITAQKIAGSKAGGMDRELLELLNPKIDWREVLREFVTTNCRGRDQATWRRLNRRFVGSGIYLPSYYSERVDCVAVGSDTSGSMSNEELAKGIAEVNSVLESVSPEKLHMIYWDAAVAAHEIYDDTNRMDFVNTTKPKGGGGTAPRVMQDYMKKENIKPDIIIQFTDGYVGDWGDDWGAPILWVIIGDNKCYAPMGVTIHLDN